MIRLENIDVTFKQDKKEIQAVREVSLSVDKGEIYGIVGYSGAGKSTLVRVINLLQRPTRGEVKVRGISLTELSSKELREERKKIGMIFQHFNLMNQRTVYDNIDFSLKYSKLSKLDRQNKVLDLLKLVGLEDKVESYPNQLSGGQKQRVAIARALVNDPEILLCDEATSALDPKTTSQILDLLQELNKKLNLTIVLITHEMQVVKNICHRVAVMENGKVIEEKTTINLFSNPEKNLTQDFIKTATHVDQALETILTHPVLSSLALDEELVEFSYVGNQTAEPLIADLYSKFQVKTNILYGNIEIIQETPIGHLIVNLKGNSTQRNKALSYLEKKEVKVKAIKQTKEKQIISLVEGGF